MTAYELANQGWENCVDPDAISKNEYTVEDAAADLNNFQADGWDLPDDITAEDFASAINDIIEETRKVNNPQAD